MKTVLKFILTILTILTFSAEGWCGESYDITFTERETIEFLVHKSSLIAIVDISEVEKINFLRKILSRVPSSAKANIISVIEGNHKLTGITIFPETEYGAAPNLRDKVFLRSGKHLVFLCKVDSGYRPTTVFSVLKILNNKVYPIWKQKDTLGDTATGVSLQEIVYDIRSLKDKVAKARAEQGQRVRS